jgi:hypothetical protein
MSRNPIPHEPQSSMASSIERELAYKAANRRIILLADLLTILATLALLIWRPYFYLSHFARTLQLCLPRILIHCRWPLRTNLVEDIKNKIIKRMACGRRDDAKFILRIRAAFPDAGIWTFF